MNQWDVLMSIPYLGLQLGWLCWVVGVVVLGIMHNHGVLRICPWTVGCSHPYNPLVNHIHSQCLCFSTKKMLLYINWWTHYYPLLPTMKHCYPQLNTINHYYITTISWLVTIFQVPGPPPRPPPMVIIPFSPCGVGGWGGEVEYEVCKRNKK